MDERQTTLRDTSVSRANRRGDSGRSPMTTVPASEPDRGLPPDTPRWVKVFGLIAVGLLLVFVIVHIATGGMALHG